MLGALIVGLVCDRFGRSFYITVPAMLLASVAVYACGLIWLHQAIPVAWTGAGSTVLHYGLWPFVLGDLAKIFAAAAVADPGSPVGPLGRPHPLAGAADQHVLVVLARAPAGAPVDVPGDALLERQARRARGCPDRGRASR